MSTASIDPGDLRRAMGAFPTGVTIVTTRDGNGGMVGFTASAFCSLSLAPPLVLVCPALTASTYPHLVRERRFAIHVLAAGQQALALAFASKRAAKAEGIDWSLSPLGNPVLPGAACVIECTLWRDHDGGDHAIIVGAVQAIALTERPVLLYHRGIMADLPAEQRAAA